MKKLIILLTLALLMASPLTSQADNDIGLYYPNFWEFDSFCDETGTIDIVFAGYNNLEADGVWLKQA